MRSQQGFSLVETLVAVALVALVGFSLVVGVHQFRILVAKSQLTQAVDRQIMDIVENIRPNINLYQIDYTLTEAERMAALNLDRLPMAWDVGILARVADCTVCAGRYGYVIQPYPVYPGLYLLTVRLTHRSWESYRDYTFLVTAK